MIIINENKINDLIYFRYYSKPLTVATFYRSHDPFVNVGIDMFMRMELSSRNLIR